MFTPADPIFRTRFLNKHILYNHFGKETPPFTLSEKKMSGRFAIKERQTLGFELVTLSATKSLQLNEEKWQSRIIRKSSRQVMQKSWSKSKTQIFTDLPTDENLEDLKTTFLAHQVDGCIDLKWG